jgi:hypothetical protein
LHGNPTPHTSYSYVAPESKNSKKKSPAEILVENRGHSFFKCFVEGNTVITNTNEILSKNLQVSQIKEGVELGKETFKYL